MSIPAQFEKAFAAFPLQLRNLVKAELAAGNRIVEISGGFPAPPVGACLKLAKLVSTRPRQKAKGLDFYERNLPGYSGEFTDDQRFYFVLEPALPPPPPPDMDAIRADREAKQRAADTELYREQAKKVDRAKKAARARKPSREPSPAPLPLPRQPMSEMDAIRAALNAREHAANCDRFRDMNEKAYPIDYGSKRTSPDAAPPPLPPLPQPAVSAVDQFRASMMIDYGKWHDGEGYNLAILKTATPEELAAIEEIILAHGTDDWRDVEALAALDSPRARVALRKALKSSNHEVRLAVSRHAPSLLSDDERTASLVTAIQGAKIYGGLTQALLQIESYHPQPIIDALLRGLLTTSGANAVHFAAMLMFIHGQAKTAFDWNQRPFFLKFNSDDGAQRATLLRELCAKIGVAPEKYLGAPPPLR